jgi:exosome complex component CSL4
VKVAMLDCFRPGDLIRAQVLSLGTMREFRLSTASAELGVVWARSLAGARLQAVSWNEMKCPESGQIEPRKVAKLV